MGIPYLITLARLVLMRSWRSTLVLGGMVTLAVGSLILMAALAVGTNDAMIRNTTGLFSGHIRLSGRDVGSVPFQNMQQGLVGLRRVQVPALIQAGTNRFEPVQLIGVDPSREQAITAFPKKVVSGQYLRDGIPNILISSSAADRLKVSVGDRLTLLVNTEKAVLNVSVCGIYRTGMSSFDSGIAFIPLSLVRPFASQMSYAVFMSPTMDLDQAVLSLRQSFPGMSVAPWTEFMPDLKQLIDLDNICMGILIVLVFAIVAAGLASIFTVFTLKNLRDHGVMQALGFRGRDTALFLIFQIAMLTVFAAAVGTVFGWGLVEVIALHGIDISQFTSHNQYFSVSGLLYPRLTWMVLCAPPLVAIFFSLLAAVWPVSLIARRTPAEILRSL